MEEVPARGEVTKWLCAWGLGDREALGHLMPLVYQEMRRIARHYMARERADNTLQATALVNEVYLRLVDAEKITWHDRAHFFAIAARTMRSILVDHARAQRSQKRGGTHEHVALDDALVIHREPEVDLVALDDALNTLAAMDVRRSSVVEMRFFGGLSVEETAEVLEVSPETVMRDWKVAKAWLMRELSPKKCNEA
jgi:RNA polymerase sigma factor (TIGR02999 family)